MRKRSGDIPERNDEAVGPGVTGGWETGTLGNVAGRRGRQGKCSGPVDKVVRSPEEMRNPNQILRGIGASRLTARTGVCAGHAA